MVDEESKEIQTLDNASEGIFNVGIISMAGQFLLTYIVSMSLSFFWTLINSQINYIYLPLLSVNTPGQVSFYFDQCVQSPRNGVSKHHKHLGIHSSVHGYFLNLPIDLPTAEPNQTINKPCTQDHQVL